jgi:hypothetical protein
MEVFRYGDRIGLVPVRRMPATRGFLKGIGTEVEQAGREIPEQERGSASLRGPSSSGQPPAAIQCIADACNGWAGERPRRFRMKSQITVRVPEDMDREIARMAEALRLRRSDIVRMALERFIRGGGETADAAPYERVKDLVGRLDTGIADLGERHRAHLLRKIAAR